MKLAQAQSRAAFGFIFAAAVLDMLSLGLTAPIFPRLIMTLTHGGAAEAAAYMGPFSALWALMQFIFQPIMGALSDRYGRRPVLLISMFGQAIDYMIMALAPTIGWLFLGRILAGLSASTFSTTNAYIADITPPEERAAKFGVIGMAFGIGFIGGPALGGLLGQLDPRLPFWAAGGLCLVNGIYGFFVVPESLEPENRAPFSIKVANPVGSYQLYRSKPILMGLAGVVFLYYLAHQVLQSTWVLYASYRYGWSIGMMGLGFALIGLGSVMVQGALVRPVVKRFGDRGALYSGLVFGVAGFFLYGAANSGGMFLSAMPIFALMGLITPGLQAIMSHQVAPNEQGRLQGANSSLMAIANMTGPILFSQIFAHSIGAWSRWAPPGLAFFVASGFMALSLALSLAVTLRPPSEVKAAA
ncbi:MAG TPA: TCR/Tet family MFS transporter [Caulobacteraceae bacterium]|nr:TCR/Tet family MFS transporter [Caulobacteraceae bacterium]